MSRLRPLTLLLALLIAPVAAAGDAGALAEAVKLYYDQGAKTASERLNALLVDEPGWDDVAWWLARCHLDSGDPEAAAALLDGREGEHIPGWRFLALEAQAAALRHEDQRARLRASRALEQSDGARDSLWRQTHAVAVALAARAGDDGEALALLAVSELEPDALPLRLRAAVPEIEGLMALPLKAGSALDEPFGFGALGGWWTLPAGGGLARRTPAPEPGVQECPGPDLCVDGVPLLEPAGVRFTPTLHEGGVLYGAAREPRDPEPMVAGLFRVETGSAVPTRLSRAPAGSLDLSPVPAADGHLFFLRQSGGATRLMRLAPGAEPEALAPELQAIAALYCAGEQLIIAAVLDGEGSLRVLPIDAEPERPSEALLERPLEAWGLGSP
jgi:hypothetical protein